MGLHDFDDETMQNHSLGSSYGYSGTSLASGKLTAPEYTLATIIIDDSGSVANFRAGLEQLLIEIVKTLYSSPRADHLLVRAIRFGSQLMEIHGFMLLADIKLQIYDGCLGDNGGTYLYGACVNGLQAAYDYAKKLTEAEYKCNALTYVLTDGVDNMSGPTTANMVAVAQKRLKHEEVGGEAPPMESHVGILVGVNIDDPTIQQYLADFARDAEFDHHLSMKDATPATLKRLAGFASQSIQQQSQAMRSGGPSQLISTLNI